MAPSFPDRPTGIEVAGHAADLRMWAAVLGFALVGVGSFLPWRVVLGQSVPGTEWGGGYFTLFVALLAVALSILGERDVVSERAGVAGPFTLAVFLLCYCGYMYLTLEPARPEGMEFLGDFLSGQFEAGVGLLLATGGSLLASIGAGWAVLGIFRT